MAGQLVGDHEAQPTLDLGAQRVRREGLIAQRCAQVELVAGEQAVAQLAVGGQPEPVARARRTVV